MDKVVRLSERVVVTKSGISNAAVMGADKFESRMETLELLSNPKAGIVLKQGIKEAKVGEFHSFKTALVKRIDGHTSHGTSSQNPQGF
ncbi:hypothetical protein AYO43_04375 [Nitrospira sp. SCGC AG-212-E16]|nr:hypothetical protein AYO43_04375 [Nitrospira sp. SCGC AG-212-E16]